MKIMDTGIVALCLICCVVITMIPCACAEDTLTRGSGFTVTIAGRPNTVYYVWVTRTFSMSGEPGDQPPVINSNIENVVQDPPGGPYVIGSYRINNGNGRTILDDVAPSTSTTSNTRYYAQVTTDIDGKGIVGFRTSSATADRKFSIAAENPQSPGETVYVTLGVPERKISIAAETAPRAVTSVPVPTVTTIQPEETTVTAPPVSVTQLPAVPVTTPRQTAPGFLIILTALVTGILILRWSR